MIARTIGGISVRKIRNTQHCLVQFIVNAINIGLESLFFLTQGTALGHQGFCFVIALIAAQQPHLLREVIDLGPQSISLQGQISCLNVEGYCGVYLLQ
jgi:hypothetical protein